MIETRIHPIWKEAAEKIVERVESTGYGFLITWEELNEILELRERKVGMTPREMDTIEFDKLDKVVSLSQTLLEDHQILIKNDRNKGYWVLDPDTQVTEGWEKEIGKAKRHLHQSLKILNNVDFEKLSSKGVEARDRNLNKTVFVISASNKRKLPEIQGRQIA